MVQRGLRRRFDPLVEREARLASPSDEGRRDLRDLPTFTIDPPSARDFDDAISAEVLDDGAVRVWVHIADVSAYVKPGSALDREALRRSNSVYVPGLVEPMLPETLSNGACSLVPGEDRLAVTVELEFVGAKVRRTAFHRSLIRSDERYSYPQVDAMFAAGEVPDGLAAARRVAAALDEARVGLAIESSEPEFSLHARRPRGELRAVGADRVAPADRAPDDRRQRGGGGAARGAQAARAVSRARAAGPLACAAAARAAGVARRADAAGTGASDGGAGGRAGGRGGSARVRPPGVHVARAAVFEAGALPAAATSATTGCARRATATSRRRSAGIPT